MEDNYHDTRKSAVDHYLKESNVQVIVTKRKLQQEDVFVILRKNGRATKVLSNIMSIVSVHPHMTKGPGNEVEQ